jgi:hypothetical protein
MGGMAGRSRGPAKSARSGIFAQTAYFSGLLYFPQTVFRCLHAFSVLFFHNGKLREYGRSAEPRRTRSNIPKQTPLPLGSRQLLEIPTVAQKTATKTGSKRRTSTRSMKATAARAAAEAGGDAVTIDRRRSKGRRSGEPSAAETPPAAALQLERRKKVSRRRQIDPTTCERDYTDQEVEFMNALDDYKRKSGRMFPTCSEVLEVIHSLGYAKMSPVGTCGVANSQPASAKPMPGVLPAWVGHDSVTEVVS